MDQASDYSAERWAKALSGAFLSVVDVIAPAERQAAILGAFTLIGADKRTLGRPVEMAAAGSQKSAKPAAAAAKAASAANLAKARASKAAAAAASKEAPDPAPPGDAAAAPATDRPPAAKPSHKAKVAPAAKVPAVKSLPARAAAGAADNGVAPFA